ncbi:hypothetical protein KIPB_011417, partial [Kipferlia bialata]
TLLHPTLPLAAYVSLNAHAVPVSTAVWCGEDLVTMDVSGRALCWQGLLERGEPSQGEASLEMFPSPVSEYLPSPEDIDSTRVSSIPAAIRYACWVPERQSIACTTMGGIEIM